MVDQGPYSHRFGPYNRVDVNPFIRGFPRPARLRFSSTVDQRSEIPIFVAKRGNSAADVDCMSSPERGTFRNCGGLIPFDRAGSSANALDTRGPAHHWSSISDLARAWGLAVYTGHVPPFLRRTTGVGVRCS